MRLDQALVQWGFVTSRTLAQDLIREGSVEVCVNGSWRPARSPSEAATAADQIRILKNETLKYVSRGGLKLESALRHLNLSVAGWTCLDCGHSTGGFTDCLLQAGAIRVVGFDVGHGQLAPRLREDARVLAQEGLHFRDLASDETFASRRPPGGFDLIVADLSFVSLAKVLPNLTGVGERLLALVKPQFEVGPGRVNKQGLVKDPAAFVEVEQSIRQSAVDLGWKVLDYFPSGVEGRDGNQEFFLFAHRVKEQS